MTASIVSLGTYQNKSISGLTTILTNVSLSKGKIIVCHSGDNNVYQIQAYAPAQYTVGSSAVGSVTGGPTTTRWVAQSFTVATEHTIYGMGIGVISMPAGASYTVSIRAASGGVPTGSDLVSVTATTASLEMTKGVIPYPDGYTIAPGDYVLILKSDSAAGASSVICGGSNPYAGGNYLYTTTSGGSWTQISDIDLEFYLVTTRMPYWIQNYTKDISAGATGNVYTDIYSVNCPTTTGATIAVNFQTGGAHAVTVYNLVDADQTSIFDKTGIGSGSSASPTTAATGNTSQDNEFLVGVCGTEGPVEDTAGTWGTDVDQNGQRTGTTGSGANSNITVSSAAEIKTAVGSFTASKSGITSRDWAIVIVAYKLSTGTPADSFCSAYISSNIFASSSVHAYMEGASKSTTHAYLEGYLSDVAVSSVHAYLFSKPSSQHAYAYGTYSIYFDVVPFTAKTNAGTQNIVGSINNCTPKLAMFMVNEGTQDDQTPVDAGATFGITDGTFGMCQEQSLEDGLAYSTPGASGGLYAGTGSSKRVINGDRMGAANHSAFITNGVTLDWITGASAAYKGAAILIGSPTNDTSILTKGGTINITNPVTGNEFTTSGIGFEPDAIIFFMDQGTDWGYGGLSFGILWKDERGNWKQRAIAMTWANGYFNYADVAGGDLVVCSGASGSAWLYHDAEVSEVTDDSFTLKVLHGDGVRDFYIGYMAIKFAPGYKIMGFDESWPSGTGTKTIKTTCDPKAVFMCSYTPTIWPYKYQWTSAMFEANTNVSGGEYIDGTDSVTGCHSFVNGSAISVFSENGQTLKSVCTGMSPGLITLNQTTMTESNTFTGVLFGKGTFEQTVQSAYMYGSSNHQSAYLNGYMFDGSGEKSAFSQETGQQRNIVWTKVAASTFGDSTSMGGFAVAISKTGQYMLVSSKEGGTYVSSNYGGNWTRTSTLAAYDASISDDGSVMVFSPGAYGDSTSGICISTNYGANWTRYYATHSQSRCCVSGDGNVIYLRSYNDGVYKTTDHGGNWTTVTPTNNYSGWVGTTLHTLRCDYDGSHIIMGAADVCHISTDGGANWTNYTPYTSYDIESVDISDDGTIMVLCLGVNTRKISIDSGATWTAMATPPKSTLNNSTAWSYSAIDYGNIECDGTASKITLTLLSTYPCISYDKSNWVLTYPNLSTNLEGCTSIAISSDGNYLLAYGQGGYTTPQYAIDLYIGKVLFQSSIHAYLAGPNPSLPAYMHGVDTTKDSHPSYINGGIEVKTSISAYMEGFESTTDAFSSQPSYTKGVNTLSGNHSALIIGGSEGKTSKSAYLNGIEILSTSVLGYTRGRDTIQNSTGGFTNGTYFTKGQQTGFIEGLPVGVVVSHKSAYLHGDYSTTFPFTDDYTDTTGDPWNEAKWVVDKSG